MTSLNAQCPCGSGKKFKRCHGKSQARTGPVAVGGKSPQQLLEQARGLRAYGQLDAALRLARQLPPGAARFDLEVEILQQLGGEDLIKAGKILSKWQHSDSTNPDPVFRRMVMAWQQGDPEAALKLAADLDNRPHQLNEYYRAVALQKAGQLEASMNLYRVAVSKNLAIDLTPEELNLEAAIQMYDTAVGKYPGSDSIDEEALRDAGLEYLQLFRAVDDWWQNKPRTSSLSAAQLNRYITAIYNLGCRDQSCYGRAGAALEHFERVLKLDGGHLLAQTNRLFTQNYLPQTPAGSASEHFAAGRTIRQQLGAAKNDFKPAALAGRRLRIGYLSADFRKHSVAYFITPVLESHQQQQFEIFAYYNQHQKDAWTERIQKAVDIFRPVADLSDSDLYQQILDDRIDILIDLNGYSRGHRVAVLALRAAPIQMHWIGYPNTSGLDVMDYRIVDQITDPSPSAEQLCSEKLLRLPDIFSVYTAPTNLPEPATPGASGRAFVFASFNHMLKLNRPLLELWSEILEAIPEARLLIKNGLVDSRTARADLTADLKLTGIDIDRVELVGRVPSSTDHLACYRQADLLLDSFPYNGTTTNCDSFIMGVPVLTVLGDSHISRVTASQLTALDLQEFIAVDKSDYVAKAIAFARNPAKLGQLSLNLRQRMQQSALMDAEKLTRELETLLLQSWVQYEST